LHNFLDTTTFEIVERTVQNLAKQVNWLPHHLRVAMESLYHIEQAMAPWLIRNAMVCHNDLHTGNILLSQDGVQFIDWTTAHRGHPFFDVAKFTLGLDGQFRHALLETYLGHAATEKEELQFQYMDLCLLMIVAANRFQRAAETMDGGLPFYTKDELETLLDLESPLPSFLDVNFADTSPKARQFGAICALKEFLERTASMTRIRS